MRPNPPVDASTEAWWEATRARQLKVQYCSKCQKHQMYPRAICANCQSTELELVASSGSGTVWSFTEITRTGVDWMQVPYTVAIVHLDEGCQVLTNIVGGDVECGARVHVTWEALEDGRHLPLFQTE